jgi:small-conductance mechanosensitive channel
MIQMPQLPGALQDTLGVSLPPAFERWRDFYLHDVGEKLIVFLVIAILLYLLTVLARRAITANIEEVNRRHTLRKYIGYGYAFLLVAFAVALFADSLAGFGTILAVLLAGVAIALQDILKSVVGWLYVSSRSGLEVGTRVEVSGVVGDVIDIGILKTTLLEVGNHVYGQQSTGRLVTVPNFRLVSESVFLSSARSPFIWEEIQVTVPFECNWRRGEEILLGIGNDLFIEIAPDVELGFKKLERRYAFKYGKLTPIVYVSLGESGVELTLRFLAPVRRRRGLIDATSRRVLAAFAAEPNLRLAHPAIRLYRPDEPGGPGDQDRKGGA